MFSSNSMKIAVLRELKYNQAAMENHGMAWYKFNIYFRTILPFVILFSEIVSAFANEESIVFLFVLIWNSALMIWMWCARSWLVSFKYKGVVNYFAIQYGVPVLNLLVALLFGDETSIGSSISNVIAYALLFIPDYIYWEKRSHLFDKKSKSMFVVQQEYSDNYENGVNKVNYCRKCGNRVQEYANFCENCGTEVIRSNEG